MNIEIEFDANYGGILRKAKIKQVAGAGSALFFHFYVDDFYWAQVEERSGQWVILEQSPSLSEEEKSHITQLLQDEIDGHDLDIIFYSGLQQL